jgi:simple sugar transport system permease protein
MSAGRGFIALALVIFGAWHPFGVSLGALLFGMATAVQFHVQALGWAIPYQFSLMLPYALTLLVLALRSERRSGPAALAQEEPEG